MKKLFLTLLTLILMITFVVPINANEVATFSEVYIPSETTNEIETEIIYIDNLTLKELEELMYEQQNIMQIIHSKAEVLRFNGYNDESFEIQDLKEQWNIAYKLYNFYKKSYDEQMLIDDFYWQDKMNEYPTATYVWRYLKGLNYSDAICAGIIGNMMLECAGGTLDLNWDIYGGYGFYGLCQWSKTYFPEAYGADLETQMKVLENTIKEQIDYAGFVYGGDGFGYEDFLKINDPGEAAICFALAYERCASQHVWPRRGYAEFAYDYFTN